MAVDTLLFVSKRASAATAALLCLIAAHLGEVVLGAPVAPSSEVRVAIGR
jgi:hypothetical protein